MRPQDTNGPHRDETGNPDVLAGVLEGEPPAPNEGSKAAAARRREAAGSRRFVSYRPSLSDWLAAVPGLQRVGSEHHGTCPACGGQDRFRVLDDGAAFCRQCAPDAAGYPALLNAAGLNGSKPLIRRLPLGSAADKVTEYEIRDTAGELQAVHGRRDKLIGKDLWWRMPDGTTGLGGRKTRTLPLYRSQFIKRDSGEPARSVCIVEGEKAADALAGAVPTMLVLGTITGASSAPDAEVLQPVIDTGLPVYLWPDRDAEGAKHMQRVAALIPGALVIADAPPDTKGADAADWARLTDRPSWESLAAAAVAPGDVVTDAPAPTDGEARPKRGGLDSAEAALHMAPDLRDNAMHVYGRGWFIKPPERALWGYDGDGAMLTSVQDHALYIGQCRKGTSARGILGELQGRMTVPGAELDVDDWLAGLPDGNGVLDLRTGEVRPAGADERITMTLGCMPEAGDPERWLPTINETFSDCDEPAAMVEYIRWWFRRALTGDCSAEAMLFLFGPKGSGKSTIADTLLHIAGSYGATLAAEHVIGDTNQHRSWLARLDRKRVVRINEMPQRGAWKTADLLSLISGEMVTANHMRQNPFEFRSRAAVLATGNHAPLAPSSSGYWRRLRLADCRHQIPDEKQDDKLRAKLKQEAGRILQWALDAPQEVPRSPAEMLMAAESLRADQDPAGEWIDDHYVSDPKGTTTSAEAYMRYTDAVGEKGQPVARRTFDRLMADRFGPTRQEWADGANHKVRRCSDKETYVKPLF